MKEFIRLLKLTLPQWPWLLLGVGCALLTLLANAALLSLAAWFLAGMALAGISGTPYNYHLPAAGIRTLAIIRTLGRYAERYFSHAATFRLLGSLRVWFFRRLEPLAPAGLGHLHSGDLFSRLKADIDHLDEFYLRFLLPLVTATAGLSLIFAFVYHFSPPLALYLALLWSLTGIALPLVLLQLGYQDGVNQVHSLSRMRSITIDLLRALEELVIFGQNAKLRRELARESRRQAAIQTGFVRLAALAEAAMTLGIGLAMAGGLLLLIPLVERGSLAGANLPMLAILTLISFEGVQQLPVALKAWGRIRTSAQRLFSLIDQAPPLPDPPPGAAPPREWSLEFCRVTFTYPGRARPVVENLDFRVAAGEKLGIIGPTGSGKSSLVNLLLKFYPLNGGEILIGGEPISRYPAEQVRSWLGVISQETYLFNASIRENLLLADPDADEELLHRALASARLEEFVRGLPAGLDTQVGQAGLKLSGGQARRLALARTILKKAPLLILDEPTEGLDAATEQALWQTLAPVMAQRTVILISHRPAGLEYMDRTISL
ncbi:thiol reductant ABC exporter subunit CydC [Desulfurivibrio sp. D14AmB]|uniref:thiol reductant ABC exporter subunit CydC n=1 Tax=Desulfurivibrio sp. D14AmB TaxID=3374370 RepID=UPI00376F4382